MGQIIVKAVDQFGSAQNFVGHIGGDDFIIITAPENVKKIVEQILKRLKEASMLMFEEFDRRRGYFEIADRQGNLHRFPAEVEVSIVGCTNLYRRFESPVQISDILAQLKNYAKKQSGNFFMMDRRMSSK
jgi:GGDEF domain-containing protein